MKIYTKALTAFLVYGAMQLVSGLVLQLVITLTTGGSSLVATGDAGAEFPLMLALCLLASGALTVLIVWLPMGMIEMKASFRLPQLSWGGAVVGLLAGLAGVVGLNLMSEFANLSDNMGDAMQALSSTPLGVLTVALFGPLCEELVFRAGIQGYLHREGAHPVVAIVFASLLFGILHFNPLQTFFASLMGVVLGILYYRTGSIVLCSVLHVINNTLAIEQMLVLGPEAADFSLCEVLGGKVAGALVMVFSCLICIALLTWLWCRTSGLQIK
ncbi:MAG: CPBP family intramembrane metalloprotease [Prevotellaceae bacterium]|nr:CPBP family intramembrane metalloprotease [Prevotellaceae bacterium]